MSRLKNILKFLIPIYIAIWLFVNLPLFGENYVIKHHNNEYKFVIAHDITNYWHDELRGYSSCLRILKNNKLIFCTYLSDMSGGRIFKITDVKLVGNEIHLMQDNEKAIYNIEKNNLIHGRKISRQWWHTDENVGVLPYNNFLKPNKSRFFSCFVHSTHSLSPRYHKTFYTILLALVMLYIFIRFALSKKRKKTRTEL